MIYRVAAFFRRGLTLSQALVIGAFLGATQICAFATGSVTLAWVPSADASVVGYNLYYGNASGAYTNSIRSVNSTNIMVSGLVDGATYYFAATAYDNNGVESPFSNEASYAVPGVAVNQPPTLNTPGNLTLNANAGQQTVVLSGITSGSASENQPLTVTASSSNPGLIPTPAVSYASASTAGTLSFTPVSNASGTATITVTVNDGQALNNTISRSFTVTVNAVNQDPTLNSISDFYVTKNATAQTVNLNGISPGTAPTLSSSTVKTKRSSSKGIKITAKSGNTKLLANPIVRYKSPGSTGALSFKPVKNATGTTTVTVTVSNGAKSAQKTFKVTVLATSQAVPAALTPAVAQVSGQFALSVAGSSGMKYIVQASTDLVHWIPVATNTAPFTYTDTHAAEFDQRYYRTVSIP